MLILFVLPWTAIADPAKETVEQVRYVRPAGKALAFECEITLRKSRDGSSVSSMTERGKTRLTILSRYDDRDRLTAAEATIATGDLKKTVNVSVVAGKAAVRREGLPAQEFEVPPGTIVTSAPDWTDTVLLCRRHDRKAGGKQTLPGLWIHPEQAGRRPTFAIERVGADDIEHGGKKVSLDRFTIWLRPESRYAAWADDAGRMIKLVPLPYKEGAANWLVLAGFEKSAAGLWPGP
jgi:hypothetical protein